MSTRPTPANANTNTNANANTSGSAHRPQRPTVPALQEWKHQGRRFSMLTAYDSCFARIFDEVGVDLLLVGDSLANVIQGEETTLPVTVDEMIYHTRAVARTAKRAMVIADMPFGSYQISAEDAVRNAVRMVKEGGAQAVKLEGGSAVKEAITRISSAEIPVMGHIGLTPQSVNRMGGFRVQGRTVESQKRVLEDAHAVEDAGAFAVVLEGMPAELAHEISCSLHIPTIGIGAGSECDGQVLVMHDMLGLSGDWVPQFVKKFADLGPQVADAAQAFIDEVQQGTFPGEEHSYR
ncbi:MAG: 3-methyl-2-oxobutanoate hydroxymethyltransferase [Deltaproteobacteria bacterium]|nr:3-methyl-2-oxobutanoate hydroxymethyltransferase [Deltaproteobacteria bacterium]